MQIEEIHFFAILLLFSTQKVTPAECGDRTGDIVFILDSSGSVGAGNFDKIKQFLKATTDGFNVGSNSVRVGIVPFSTSVYNTAQLTSFDSNSALKFSISNIPYNSGSTNTSGAIRFARISSFGSYSRNFVPKMAVIITDGKSNNKALTLSEAQLLRKNGVIIFSVGVGDGVDESELQGMATKTSYVFDVSTFDTLNSIRDNLAKPKCKVTSCNHPGIPVNGYLHGSDFSQGKSVTYSCKSGYKLVGNQQRTCQRDKSWSGGLPTCIFLNTCSSNPSQNGGSCIDGEDRYTCNCIQGYTGVHCEKDIHPPIKMYCPSEIQRDSSSPLVNITWTAPDFYDPFGHNLEVTSNYPNHGSFFIWGNYTAQYTALKPFNGLRVYCIFNITIKLGVTRCNSNPCQNGGSCIGDRNKYICNCIHGSTGVHCEKDIQPPITKNCPSGIRRNTSSRFVKVTWRPPDFYDPFGHDVEVTTNYPEHGSFFRWGDHTVQYTALKPSNGLTANCTFSINTRPLPCPNISAPLNGALVCNGWMTDFVRLCVVFCQMGTRPSPDHDLPSKYFCGGSGHWHPTLLSSCQRSSLEPPEREAFHYFMSCDKKHIDRMKKIYINSLSRILCSKFKDLCKPENVDVQCSESTLIK